MWIRLGAVAALVLSCAQPAMAQNAPVRIYGPIVSIAGQTLTVTNRDGHTIAFDLAPQGRIVSNGVLDVRTIKAGDVIAVDEEGGKPIQAHTQAFAHGANAPAQRPMVTNPKAIRYLGVVSAATPTANSVKLTIDLEKNGGKKQVELTNSILHYRNETQSMADVKPGLIVMANANRGAGGKLVSGFTTIEKNYQRPIDIGD
jgi:YD repeat-containing protein